MSAFVERVALHQSRFRAPGVQPDARGVLLGTKGMVLFPSLDRVVAFFRAYGEGSALDEILAGMAIQRVISPLKTRELVVTLVAESSYRMDRIAAVAKLAGGDVFTGTQRHFVQYRDATSPLGYDIGETVEAKADLVVYHQRYRQAYNVERDVPFRELVLKLAPVPQPRSEVTWGSRLLATAEVGIGHALVSYLFRWRAKARVALAEWPATSAFDDGPRRLHVFELEDAPPRIVQLMRSLPGVHLYEPHGVGVAVEVGYRHPIALDSCKSLFPPESLTLFRGDGTVFTIESTPPFAPVRSLVRADLSLELDRQRTTPRAEDAEGFALDLRLAPTLEPPRNVVGIVLPIEQRPWLAKLLYVLPPRALDGIRMAMAGDRVILLDPRGIESIPLGRFYSEVARRVYVPTGLTLVPNVHASVLEDLTQRGQAAGHHVFFEAPEGRPVFVAESAFAPVSRAVLRELSGQVLHTERPEVQDPPLPLLEYGPESLFPLWGAPGKP